MILPHFTVLIFGEILWDVFGAEAKIGGAPYNFGAHLARLGEPAALVTAVGRDDLGDQALELAQREGLRTDLVRRSPLPTGRCQVTLESGVPRYDLLEPVAYDDIRLRPEDLEALRNRPPRALYFGSLGQRGETSRRTLEHLLDIGGYEEIFCDINVRAPFYTKEVLELCLSRCTILKISREEAGILQEIGLLSPSPGEAAGEEGLCQALPRRYGNLKLVLVTLDKDGAMAYDTANGRSLYSAKPRSKLVSAVGAGDSFAACFLFHYLRGAPLETCLDKGVRLSDYVVTRLGAVPELPEALLRSIRCR